MNFDAVDATPRHAMIAAYTFDIRFLHLERGFRPVPSLEFPQPVYNAIIKHKQTFYELLCAIPNEPYPQLGTDDVVLDAKLIVN